MLKNILFLSGFFIIWQASCCQPLVLPPAMLHSLPVPGRSDIWSSFVQPAALAGHKRWQAALLGEQRFGLPDLADYLVGVVVPAGAGSFSLHWRKQGKSRLNWQQVCLAYGMSLGKVVDIGAGFRYNQMHLSEYGRIAMADLMAGLLLRLSGKIQTNLYASYVSRPAPGGQVLMQPVYKMGVCYRVSAEAGVGWMLQLADGMKPDVLAAVDYDVKETIRLRCSFSALRGSWGLGMIWTKGACRIDAFTSHHLRLGFSPGLGMVYQGKSNPGE